MPGIVIHDLQVVYWPVPKNACTTLKTFFAKHLNLKYMGLVHDAPFSYTEDKIGNYFNFAVVRNPYDRLQSLFVNKILSDNRTDTLYINGVERAVFGRYSNVFHGGMTYDEFIDIVISIDDKDPHFNFQYRQIPEDVRIFKLEETLFFMLLPKLNKSQEYKRIQDKRIYNHYYEDFARFGY